MDLVRMVGEARERRPQPMPPQERRAAVVSAIGLLVAVAAIDTGFGSTRPFHPAIVAALVVAYAMATRVRFELSWGMALPTQLVSIPMLFVAPLPFVPLLVAAGYLLGRLPDFARHRAHPDRWVHSFGHAWFSVGPTIVLAAWAAGPPRLAHVPVYAAALVAEALFGAAEAVLGDHFMYGTAVGEALRVALWSIQIDVLLTPLAYVVAAVVAREPVMILAILPLFQLLRVFARERSERYAAMLELNQTYRGTVMVLSDVVEADDSYTAQHCRSVVDVATAVGRELGLGQDEMQELEIVALLHDVGKIAIPNEVLNKPSSLTDAEFELMKTHTTEGQALLDRVGGKLKRIGAYVRSCHERWDGRGYPDGLAGEQIPVMARIVFACDAYSAMTTDRPYRKALTHEAALAELRDGAGSQFDPRVVEALLEVVADGYSDVAESYSDAVRALLALQPRAGEMNVPA